MLALLLLSLLSLCLSANLYAVLGVTPRSSEAQIKKAFKEMSLKYHPDRNSDPSASAKYQQIVQAYEILKDPVKKKHYDHTGSTDSSPQQGHRQQYSNFGHQFEGFEEIFRQFEEQANHRRRHHFNQQRQQQGQSGEYEYVQYIDEFGRIRTVMMKRGGQGTGSGISDGVLEVLMIPLQMMLVFLVAYILVSIFSNGDAEKQKQNGNHNPNRQGPEENHSKQEQRKNQ